VFVYFCIIFRVTNGRGNIVPTAKCLVNYAAAYTAAGSKYCYSHKVLL
jgi:hypothetical protein